jgi:hypothetical protein
MPDNQLPPASEEPSSQPDETGNDSDTRTGGYLNDYARQAREKWESEQAARSAGDGDSTNSDEQPSAKAAKEATPASDDSTANAATQPEQAAGTSDDSDPAEASAPDNDDAPPEASDMRMGSTTHDLKKEAARALHMQFEKEQAEKEIQQRDRVPITSSEPDAPQADSAPVVIELNIHEQNTPLKLAVKGEMIVGRGDVRTGYRPDIDLTPYGAYRLGISRRHARLTRQNSQLYLIDSGSRNGTAINGTPLPPDEPHPLQDGDELRFGNLSMTLHVPVNGT